MVLIGHKARRRFDRLLATLWVKFDRIACWVRDCRSTSFKIALVNQLKSSQQLSLAASAAAANQAFKQQIREAGEEKRLKSSRSRTQTRQHNDDANQWNKLPFPVERASSQWIRAACLSRLRHFQSLFKFIALRFERLINVFSSTSNEWRQNSWNDFSARKSSNLDLGLDLNVVVFVGRLPPAPPPQGTGPALNWPQGLNAPWRQQAYQWSANLELFSIQASCLCSCFWFSSGLLPLIVINLISLANCRLKCQARWPLARVLQKLRVQDWRAWFIDRRVVGVTTSCWPTKLNIKLDTNSTNIESFSCSHLDRDFNFVFIFIFNQVFTLLLTRLRFYSSRP